MESWFCIWEDLENPNNGLNLVATNLSATPIVGKLLLLPHNVLQIVALDAFRRGVKNFFRNDDKAEQSLQASKTKIVQKKRTYLL